MSPRPPFPPPQAKSGKHWVVMGVLLGIMLLGGILSFLMSGAKVTRPAPKKDTIVTILPPPPLPLPLPKPEPPKQEPPPDEKKEIVEEKLVEPPPDEPDASEPPQEVLGTNIQGGPGMNGLGSKGSGGGSRTTLGGAGNKQARIDWYAKSILVTTIKQALESNPSTRHIQMDNGIRIWVDKDGRVTRIKPLGGTSNSAALEQVLVGLQTSQAPPSGMPSYIDFKIKARKPGA